MNPSLAPAWRDYRLRRRACAAAMAGGVLVLAGAGKILHDVTGSDAAVHLLAAGWMAGSLASFTWFAAFRCPFCGGFFHWTWWFADPLSDECLHCGFRKWRDPHAARALSRR